MSAVTDLFNNSTDDWLNKQCWEATQSSARNFARWFSDDLTGSRVTRKSRWSERVEEALNRDLAERGGQDSMSLQGRKLSAFRARMQLLVLQDADAFESQRQALTWQGWSQMRDLVMYGRLQDVLSQGPSLSGVPFDNIRSLVGSDVGQIWVEDAMSLAETAFPGGRALVTGMRRDTR